MHNWTIPKLQAARFKVDSTHWNKIAVDNILQLKDWYDQRDNFVLIQALNLQTTDVANTWTVVRWNTVTDDNSLLLSSNPTSPDFTFELPNGTYKIEARESGHWGRSGWKGIKLYNTTELEDVATSNAQYIQGNESADRDTAIIEIHDTFTLDNGANSHHLNFQVYSTFNNGGTVAYAGYMPGPASSVNECGFYAQIWRLD